MNFTNVAAATALLCAVGAYAKGAPADIIKQAKTLNEFTALEKAKMDALKLSDGEVDALKSMVEADWKVEKIEEVLNTVDAAAVAAAAKAEAEAVTKAIEFVKSADKDKKPTDADLKIHNMSIDQFNTLKAMTNLTPKEFEEVMASSGSFFTTRNILIGAGIVVAGLACGGYFYMKKGDDETDL